MIEREYYIKDLFRPKQILNQFSDLYFESFKTFSDLYMNGYITLGKVRLHIPIENISEFILFSDLINETEIQNVFLRIESGLLKEIFKKEISSCNDKNFAIITDTDMDISTRYYFDNNKEAIKWISENPLYIEVDINYDNYDHITNDLVSIYNKFNYRFFKINFDWSSFEEMKFKEVHEFCFFIRQLINWISFSNKKDIQTIKIYKEGLPIFISNDIKLYESKKAFEDENFLLDLYKYRDSNGEDIPYKDLNRFRSYMDIKYDYDLNNYYQNKKVMGDYQEIPYIQQILRGDLNAF